MALSTGPAGAALQRPQEPGEPVTVVASVSGGRAHCWDFALTVLGDLFTSGVAAQPVFRTTW